MKKTILGAIAAIGLMTSYASGASYTLSTANSTLFTGNLTTSFYQVSGAGVESGSAASLYSSTLGGSANAGWWVEISFDGNPQPVLTSAFLKAANEYLYWDAADLTAFNAGTFTSIRLENIGAGGIVNSNDKYQGTSHAGLNGAPGTTTKVPDGGSTLAMIGLVVAGLSLVRRKAE